MIYLSGSSIMVMDRDGEKRSFDSEELQTKIINSCISSGVKDYWIAEDIANAVESALTFQSKNGVVFSINEINSYVLKILQDTGYPEVADDFHQNNTVSKNTIDVNEDEIKSLFIKRFGLKGSELNLISNRALNACRILNIKKCDTSLVTELGRYYKSSELKLATIETVPPENILVKSPWVLTEEEIIELTSQETRYFIEHEAISIGNISNLFPSLKIDFRLEKIAKINKFSSLITELLLLPCLTQPTESIEEIIMKTSDILKLKKIIPNNKKLPVYLRFSDINQFAKDYLGADINAECDSNCVNSIAASILENINHPVFTRGISRKKKNKKHN